MMTDFFCEVKVKVLFLVFVFLCFVGCSKSNISDHWSEELLLQIDELRQNQIKLTSELNRIKEYINEKNSKKNEDVGVSYDFINVLGDVRSKVGILEFSDFECPFCARHAKIVFPQLKADFVDKGFVQYALSDFPLSFHAGAKSAAIATRCAGEQNKYWEMYTAVFEDAGRSRKQEYQPLAEQLNLNVSEFKVCLKKPEIAKAVEEDIAFGDSVGVDGTPRFLVGNIVNGQMTNVKLIKGAQSYEVFANAIEKLQSN